MGNLKVNVNAILNEIDFVEYINKIPYYSKELKEAVIDIVKDDIRFQTEHKNTIFETEDSKNEYFSFWLKFINAFVSKNKCEMGIIEYPNNDCKKVVLVQIDLTSINKELALDVIDGFWTHNNGYVGSFRLDNSLISWTIDGTEFFIELCDR